MRTLRNVLILLLTLALAMGCACADDEDEEVSFVDFIGRTATPAPGQTATPAPGQTNAPTQAPVIQADGSVTITISALGDITMGRDATVKGTSLFEKELKKQDGDIHFPFKNTRDILSKDDLTIANLECVLTDDPVIPSNKRGNDFLFYAPPSYTEILQNGSVEAVAFDNNHCMDFGQDGYDRTTLALDEAGIVWSNETTVGEYAAQGITIGMLSYRTFDQYSKLFDLVPQDVQRAKEKYDLVIVSFHWGAEKDYYPNANQKKLAHMTVDAGADLILGHHSHRINPIEQYNGVYIVYSLANFSFAGNNKPSDMSTFIFQTRFKKKDGVLSNAGMRIIPCRISSRTDYNDFIVTPYTSKASIDSVIKVLTNNGEKQLADHVSGYPLEWQ